MKKVLEKPEDIFILFCIFWGMLFLFINPPFQASDETSHMYRMYGFCEGTFFTQKLKINGTEYAGLNLPVNLVNASQRTAAIRFNPDKKTGISETKEILATPMNKDKKLFYTFYIPVYTPISYFPAFIVLWVMKIFNIAPVAMMYVLRFCTLLTYLAMIYYAIKITPVKKWLFLSTACLPSAIYLASAVNTDAIVTGFAFLTTAWALNLAFNPKIEKISGKNLWVFAIFCTLLNICKSPYMFLGLLFLLIPKNKFESRKSQIIPIFYIFLFNIFLNILIIGAHFLLFKGLVTVSANKASFNYLAVDAIKNPVGFLGTVWNTFYYNWFNYFEGAIALFGWSDTHVPPYVIWLFIGIITFTGIFNDKNEPRANISAFGKIISALIFIIVTLTTLLACMAAFGKDFDFNTVMQFQGRYWIPLLPLIFLCFNCSKGRINFKWVKVLFLTVYTLMFLICTVEILFRFYV